MNLFDQVFEIVKKIPKGKVMTYGQIAKVLGTRDVRKIGWALHSNKNSDLVPCHRVVNKDGRLAPSYAFGGPMEQKAKLLEEGVEFIDEDHVDMNKYQLKNVIANEVKQSKINGVRSPRS